MQPAAMPVLFDHVSHDLMSTVRDDVLGDLGIFCSAGEDGHKAVDEQSSCVGVARFKCHLTANIIVGGTDFTFCTELFLQGRSDSFKIRPDILPALDPINCA